MGTYFKYKGYQGTAETEQETGKLYGKLAFIRHVVTYEADTLEELEKEFHFSVNEYLSDCEESCKTPDIQHQKFPFSEMELLTGLDVHTAHADELAIFSGKEFEEDY